MDQCLKLEHVVHNVLHQVYFSDQYQIIEPSLYDSYYAYAPNLWAFLISYVMLQCICLACFLTLLELFMYLYFFVVLLGMVKEVLVKDNM